MERDNFDTELLIEEVEKRIAIWDMESADYANRLIKRRNWEEIVEIFCEAGDSDEKKKTLGMLLQKKWKGLRDGFVREMKRIKTTPSGSKASKNKYIYFERLMFLERSTRNKTTDSNIVSSPAAPEEQDISGDGEDVMRPPVSQPKKKKKMNAADEEFLAIISKNLAPRNQPQTSESDDDKLFCLSLHKELIKVPEEMRLQAKIDLMNVLQKAQRAPCHSPSHYIPSPAPSPQYNHQAGMTHRGQRGFFNDTGYNETDPSASSFSRYCTGQRNSQSNPSPASNYNNPSPASNYNNPSPASNYNNPSPASTQDSQESELMELYRDC
ncbi:uncharacterized protein LOC125490692 [Plutella xylostella]|uniref:uncharacterized protein LOC125490692 n=1 Tax=Plutella xylostella TaxID=51655 RepID=UPI002032A642|nr:uncharacterized protein LOC125490692 [Plutella xylostella]